MGNTLRIFIGFDPQKIEACDVLSHPINHRANR